MERYKVSENVIFDPCKKQKLAFMDNPYRNKELRELENIDDSNLSESSKNMLNFEKQVWNNARLTYNLLLENAIVQFNLMQDAINRKSKVDLIRSIGLCKDYRFLMLCEYCLYIPSDDILLHDLLRDQIIHELYAKEHDILFKQWMRYN